MEAHLKILKFKTSSRKNDDIYTASIQWKTESCTERDTGGSRAPAQSLQAPLPCFGSASGHRKLWGSQRAHRKFAGILLYQHLKSWENSALWQGLDGTIAWLYLFQGIWRLQLIRKKKQKTEMGELGEWGHWGERGEDDEEKCSGNMIQRGISVN